jgi:hypothetical protein
VKLIQDRGAFGASKWVIAWVLLALGTGSASAQRTRANQREEDSPPRLPVSDSNTGYIDNAIVGTQIRIRYDSALGNDRPDRAEFFYAKCGCFRTLGFDALAPGPVPENPVSLTRIAETEINYLDIRVNLEYAFDRRFSWFVEVPFRYLKPEINKDARCAEVFAHARREAGGINREGHYDGGRRDRESSGRAPGGV